MLLENNPYPQDGRVRKEAISLTSAGHQVTIICPRCGNQAWTEMIENVRVYRFPVLADGGSKLGFLLEYSSALISMFFLSLFVFFRRGFDVIHTHNPPDLLVLIAAFYKILGKRFVFDHHDLSPEMYQIRYGSGGFYKILLFFERISLKLADHVIATNQSYKRIEMERGGIPENKITIVRNGPDLTRIPSEGSNIGPNRPGKTTLCYVGEMAIHDGIDYLLRALQILIYELGRKDVYCILVGEGDAFQDLKRLSRDLDLTEYVRFTGNVPHSQVFQYLYSSDICLAPEPLNPYNNHSTMIKITEYLAVSKPVVAFDLTEHRVTAGEAALYARPNDEAEFARNISIFMDDPEGCRKMGKIGRRRIEAELAWKHQEKHLIQAYESMLHSRSKLRFSIS